MSFVQIMFQLNTRNDMTEELKQQLREWADRYETSSFVSSDPVQFPRLAYLMEYPFHLKEDEKRRIETIAVITSWISYGNREQIIKTADKVFEIVNNKHFLEYGCYKQFENDNRTLYRFFRWSDLFDLCERLSVIYAVYPTLESYVLRMSNNPLEGIIHAFRGVKGFPINKTSACKRLCMLLRWLVRRNSPVDIGCWTSFDASSLIIPLDTHVHRMAVELGLTKRNTADMTTALEITEALKEVFSEDPTRGDFALFGYGIEHKSK